MENGTLVEPSPISEADFPSIKAAAQMARGIKPDAELGTFEQIVFFFYFHFKLRGKH